MEFWLYCLGHLLYLLLNYYLYFKRSDTMRGTVAKLIRKVARKDMHVAREKYKLSFRQLYRKLKKMYLQGDRNERRIKCAEIRELCSC